MKTIILQWALARAREPSTWAGIAAVIAAAPIPGSILFAQSAQVLGTAVAGLLAIWLSEKK